MPAVPPSLPTALHALDQTLDAPRRPGVGLGNWRWLVRQRMAAVRESLTGEAVGSDDGWLAARGGSAFEERNALLSRLAELGPSILENPDAEAARADVKRLVADIRRHLHRLAEAGPDGGASDAE